jgi:ribosomal protein S18 acetylase RimI-like enzyme
MSPSEKGKIKSAGLSLSQVDGSTGGLHTAAPVCSNVKAISIDTIPHGLILIVSGRPKMTNDFTIRSYDPSDEAAVIGLWRACGLAVPWNNPAKDIARKLSFQKELFVVALIEEELVGTVMAGYEGHRGWINYLAVSPAHQRKGVGRRLMQEAEMRIQALGCPKINLQVRRSNTGVIEFYRKLGFSPDDVVSLGKRLEAD